MSALPDQNAEWWAGNTGSLVFTIQDAAAAAVSIAGASARWWMGKNAKATGDQVYITKAAAALTVAGPGAGGFYTVTVPIARGDTKDLATGTFYHELEIDAGGDIVTAAVGSFTLYPAIGSHSEP